MKMCEVFNPISQVGRQEGDLWSKVTHGEMTKFILIWVTSSGRMEQTPPPSNKYGQSTGMGQSPPTASLSLNPSIAPRIVARGHCK